MTIRPATEEDIPAILALSKLSLGELGGMRTEEYWRWKHLQNPFEASPVLLAFDGEKLIGLRAFMKWRFRYQGKIVQAYRAVDTSTHPEHQGKGIFSKLTLTLIDQLQAGPPSLIFNTPNSKSMPGYVKMGWKVVGKTRLRVKIYPINLVKNKLSSRLINHPPAPVTFPEDIKEILSEWLKAHPHVVMTDYSVEYLRWRYQQVPVLKYGVKLVRSHNSNCIIIYRVKQSSSVCELRLVEVIYSGTEQKSVVQSAIHELAEVYRPDVMTVLADPEGRLDALLPFGFFNAEKRGLTITGRKVNDDTLVALLLNHSQWYLSAGGMELF